jgi:hypothetical protein
VLGRFSAVLLIGLTSSAFAADASDDDRDFPAAPGALAMPEAPVLNYDLNTPIQTLALNPATAAIVNANIPGLLEDDNYSMFKSMSLKTVASLSNGRISGETLQTIAGQLKSVPISTASK